MSARYAQCGTTVLVDQLIRGRSQADDMARTENAAATRNDSVLVPLRSVENGGIIPGFPATVGAVSVLTGKRSFGCHGEHAECSDSANMSAAQEAIVILRALGLPVDGNVAETRRRVRLSAGVGPVIP